MTDKRVQHRARVLKRAFILCAGERPEIPCTVRNMHSGGAELKVLPEDPVRPEFLLHIPLDGVTYNCCLRWRHGNRCGIEFKGIAEKPAWHYG